LTSCLLGFNKSVLQKKKKIVGCHTADSKPVKQEVNGTVILPAFSIPCPSLLSQKTFGLRSSKKIDFFRLEKMKKVLKSLFRRRHDIRHNDIYHNDTPSDRIMLCTVIRPKY